MSAAPETLGFQAEVKDLLRLMIHSLYSHREIFLRELISNASDANDKLRFLALGEPALLADDTELAIWVSSDPEAGTLTIRDNGVGLDRDEAIAHLGTIAKSGTAEFFQRLSGDQQRDAQLIGQFGVGFYSAFIVAERVEVFSRRAGQPAEAGVRWESRGEGDFTIETIARAERGTSVVLHLKEDAKEFLDAWKLRSLVQRYSDHIAFPVRMPKDGATLASSESPEWEAVNQAQALWLRPKSELTDTEYQDFYRHISHDGTEPLAWSHNRVEGKREYTSLLYVPGRAPFDLWQRDAARGLKLYVRRVFIMDDAEQFLPLYLRFIKGIVDSSDLPLNVSRELLQQDKEVEAMRAALTRRALDMLTKLADEQPEKYRAVWKEFGRVLKEGLGEDHSNRERLLPLLRFASTASESDEESVSLKDYVARMKSGQERIYYIVADSFAAARHSPHLELLRRKGVEVLLMADRVDEWAMAYVSEFDGKRFKDAARGDLELGALEDEADKKAAELVDNASQPLLARFKGVLGERVADVRSTHRLQDSPAVLVRADGEMSEALRRMLEASGQKVPDARPALELNVTHPLLQHMDKLAPGEDFDELAQLLYEQAQLTDGAQLANPAQFAQRLNKLLVKLVQP